MQPGCYQHNLLEAHALNLDQNGPTALDSDSSDLTELANEDLELLSMEDEDEDNQLIPSEEMFDPVYEADPFPAKIFQMLAENVRHSKEISLAECTNDNGRLRFRGKLWVPDYQDLMLRDSPLAGHPGRAKTLELVKRHYYWPSMHKYVERYVRNCHVCSRSKPTRHGKQGPLCPLPVPEH